MGDTPSTRSAVRAGSGIPIPRSANTSTSGSSRLASMQADFQRKLILDKEKRLGTPPSSQQSKQAVTDNNGNMRNSSSAMPSTFHKCAAPRTAMTGTAPPPGKINSPLSTSSTAISSPYMLRKANPGNSNSAHRQFSGRLNGQQASLPNNGNGHFSPNINKRGVPSKQDASKTPSTTQRAGNNVATEVAKKVDTPTKLARGLTFVKPKPTVLVLPADSHIGPEQKTSCARDSRDQECLARAADTSTGSDTTDETDPSPRPACPKTNAKPRSVPTRNVLSVSSTKPQPPAASLNNNSMMRENGPSTPSYLGAKLNPASKKYTPTSTPKPAAKRTPTLGVTKTSKAFTKIERTEPPPPGTVPCSNCGRCFLEERVAKHEAICKKSNTRKRKIFDPTIMRVAGTEAEAYLKLASKKLKPPGKNSGLAGVQKKADWRQKHEDFIRTIRAAKEYQKHIASGGNPRDLPPPPPSDYSDYVPCPHCKRKFNAGAAERHIPKCLSNKNRRR